MKFIKTLLAVAVMGAAMGTAQAESNIATGAGALSASARLNFRVTIPRVLYLRVGSGTDFTPSATIDEVLFTATSANIASGTAIAGTPANTAVRVLSTAGSNVSLTATGAAGGLVNGANSIAWSRITGSSSNAALPHPAIGNGVAGAVSTLTATAGVVNQSANWSFNYANATTDIYQAGDYTGQVTYTATAP
jgi:hypothetical protein